MTKVHTSIRQTETTVIERPHVLVRYASTLMLWVGGAMVASFVFGIIAGSIPGMPGVVAGFLFSTAGISMGIFLTLLTLLLVVGMWLPRERVVSTRAIQ